MEKGIKFYALYKLRVLIIPPVKEMTFVYLEGYQMKFKKVALYRYSLLKLIFSLFCGVSLRKHYIIKARWSVI